MKFSDPIYPIVAGVGSALLVLVLVLGGLWINREQVLVSVIEDSLRLDSPSTGGGGASSGLAGLLSGEKTIVEVVGEANPAVVSVIGTKEVAVNRLPEVFLDPFFGDFFERFGVLPPPSQPETTERRQVSGGSGFFVSADGLVVTNRHVVADSEADYEIFTGDGRSFSAEVIARDAVLDIAILRVEAKNSPYLRFGDSDEIQLGQTVVVIGNALGEFQNTVSVGVVSGLSRSIVAGDALGSTELLDEVIQTDAAINPGNSGGPMLDLNGNVIGVSVAVASGSENIGFALPASSVAQVVESIKTHGEIIRPYLGIRYVRVTPEISRQRGLPVDYGALIIGNENYPAVVAGSPASRAGLLEGDIILEIDGVVLDHRHNLAGVIRQKKIGETISLRVRRDSREIDLRATLDRMPAEF